MIKISIRKILIIIMLVTVLISISVFSLVSNSFVNDYFDEYIEETYDKNVENIIEYSKIAITDSKLQKAIINSYIVDPIYYIEILDTSGTMVLNSGSQGQGNRFVYDESKMTLEYFDIIVSGKLIGEVLIVRTAELADTETKQVFTNSIYTGAVSATAVVVIIMGLLGFIIIRRISKDSRKVVVYATDEDADIPKTRIKDFTEIVSSINTYKNKLAVKEKIKKEKFDQILHETKTPITVLKSQLEGVSDGLIDIDKSRAEEMLKEIENLDVTLKDATSIIEGNQPVENIDLKEIDYSERLEKVVNSLRTRFEKKGIKLLYKKKKFIVNTDINILDNVMYNILINGYKYTDEGSVLVETTQNEIIITDTGIGMDKEDLERIFEPYFRSEKVKNISGEGLGLYNVRNNLDKIDAEIIAESELGKYTKFRIMFK